MSAASVHRLGGDSDWIDLFCGAGGATSGLVLAGHRVRLAANHWQRAIDTHSANHPDTDHACVDINHYDMRRLPRARFLWASVICTEVSPAGGKRRSPTKGQMRMLEYGSIADAGFERTRACALDVIRATEVHRYDVVIVENVVEFATDWALFDWWRQGMELLGYQHRVFSMSAAHVGGDDNEPAPQWRDRIIIQFVRKGLPVPDLTPTPVAWCAACGEDVNAVQAWRNGASIGKYRAAIGPAYDYRCPNSDCRHAVVEPYVRPASTIIDWGNIGTLIGDRKRPLVPATIAKIRRGLAEYADLLEPILITATHGGEDPRAIPARMAPLPTRTVKIGDGFVVPPGAFVHEQWGTSTYRPITHPLSTMATSLHHGLVIPYRNSAAKPTSDPLLTMATRDAAALVRPAYQVEDCHYRMLQPREALMAQRFGMEYIVHGNKSEQTMQAGNAVPVNLSQFIGRRITEALDGAA